MIYDKLYMRISDSVAAVDYDKLSGTYCGTDTCDLVAGQCTNDRTLDCDNDDDCRTSCESIVVVDISTEYLLLFGGSTGIDSASHTFNWPYETGPCQIKFTLEDAEPAGDNNGIQVDFNEETIGYVNQGFDEDTADNVTWVFTTGLWGGNDYIDEVTCNSGSNTITIHGHSDDAIRLVHVRVEKIDDICDDGNNCGVTGDPLTVNGWGIIFDNSLADYLDTNLADCIKYGHCNRDGSLTRAGMISYDYRVGISLEGSENILIASEKIDNLMFQAQPNDLNDLIERFKSMLYSVFMYNLVLNNLTVKNIYNNKRMLFYYILSIKCMFIRCIHVQFGT